MQKRVFFRADGNGSIGLGHVMRCMALAEMLKENFQCHFIFNNPDQSVSDLVSTAYNFISINCDGLTEELMTLPSFLNKEDIVVLDGYHFDETYQWTMKQMVSKLVVIDDKAEQFFCADVVFNHGDISVLPDYRKADTTIVYSGAPYLILRKDFLQEANRSRHVEKLDTVFVCMGGADPFQITPKVLEAISSLNFINFIYVVSGKVNVHAESIDKIANQQKNTTIELVQNASAAEMVSFISNSDLAITTSSSVALEACCVRVPLLSGIVIDNQNAIHSQLVTNGCCHSIGNWKTVTKENIIEAVANFRDLNFANDMILRQTALIDGKSSYRILSVFKSLAA